MREITSTTPVTTDAQGRPLSPSVAKAIHEMFENINALNEQPEKGKKDQKKDKEKDK